MRHRWRPDVSPCFLGQFHTRSLIRFRVFSLGLLLVQARSGLGLGECCFLGFFCKLALRMQKFCVLRLLARVFCDPANNMVI